VSPQKCDVKAWLQAIQAPGMKAVDVRELINAKVEDGISLRSHLRTADVRRQ
jgi:hypothetical protein